MKHIHKWSSDEIKFLTENYHKFSLNELSNKLDIESSKIHSKAKFLKLNKYLQDDQRILLLQQNYNNKSLKELKKITKLSQAQIIGYAYKNKLSRNYNKCDVSEILSETSLGYYLLGLILSDGSIQNKQLKIALQIRDKLYLEDICQILNININTIDGILCHACGTSEDVIKLSRKFDIKKNKTKNPPSAKIIPKDLNKLVSLVCGLIDGDGCIGIYCKKYNYMKIEIVFHYTWDEFYQAISDSFEKITPRLNKHRPTTNRLVFYDKSSRYLYDIAKNLNLPLMKRKWDKFK